MILYDRKPTVQNREENFLKTKSFPNVQLKNRQTRKHCILITHISETKGKNALSSTLLSLCKKTKCMLVHQQPPSCSQTEVTATRDWKARLTEGPSEKGNPRAMTHGRSNSLKRNIGKLWDLKITFLRSRRAIFKTDRKLKKIYMLRLSVQHHLFPDGFRWIISWNAQPRI